MLWFNDSCRVHAEEWSNRHSHQRPRQHPPTLPSPDRVLVMEDEVIELGPRCQSQSKRFGGVPVVGETEQPREHIAEGGGVGGDCHGDMDLLS
jgi:hypothetical protein